MSWVTVGQAVVGAGRLGLRRDADGVLGGGMGGEGKDRDGMVMETDD